MSYWVAGAIVVSAVVSSKASSKASKAQIEAARENMSLGEQQLEENRRQFDIFQENLAPFQETGLIANEQINQLLAGDRSGFELDPGFQFQQEQGERAINRLAAQQGRLNTGAQAKDLIRFNQNLSNQSYNDYVNRLLAISGKGQAAVGTGGQAGQNFINTQGAISQNIAGQRTNAANARATNFINQSNILSNSLDQYIRFNSFNQGRGGGGGGGGSGGGTVSRPANSLTAVA